MVASATRDILWGGYFLLLSGFWVLGLLFGTKDPVTIASGIVNGLCLVGLWGYMSDKAIGTAGIWAAILALELAASVLSAVLLVADGTPLAVVVAVGALVAPLLFALYRYAFRSKSLWAAPEA